jgi:putative heme transporter
LSGAISAMLIYRLISWLFLAAVGWVVFFFMFRTENDADPDALGTGTDTAAETDTAAGLAGNPASTHLKNGNGATPVDPADAALEGPVPPDPAAKTGETSATRRRRGAAQN